jgi:hypothetical protein
MVLLAPILPLFLSILLLLFFIKTASPTKDLRLSNNTACMLGHCLIEPDREHDQSEQLLPTNNLCKPLDQLGRRPGGHQLVFELGIRVLSSLVVGTGAEQTAVWYL